METQQRKNASSHVQGRISSFFSSGGSKLGVPFELQRGPQGPAHGASGTFSLRARFDGPLWIPLQLLPWLRSSSGVEAGTSGFLSHADMDLGVPLGFPPGGQASFCVETCTSALLSSWKSSVRLPVELHRHLWLSLEVPQGYHTCHHVLS